MVGSPGALKYRWRVPSCIVSPNLGIVTSIAIEAPERGLTMWSRARDLIVRRARRTRSTAHQLVDCGFEPAFVGDRGFFERRTEWNRNVKRGHALDRSVE